MRLRNVKGSKELIGMNPFVIQEPENYKGIWSELFKNDNPIFIEVGMGKGKFITELAKNHPENNYIGIEKFSSVLIRALEKREGLELSNLLYIRMEAEHLEEIFDSGEIAGIYLNFSDPWPKDRHAKRRLTSKEFFKRYDNILKKEGEVVFKTDNIDLFNFSLEQVEQAGWKLGHKTFDLHHCHEITTNVMTEYEEKFSAKGNPICRLSAYR